MMQKESTKYLKLKDYLKQEIINGRIKPGEKIPSENTLVEKFSVSRHTVRKAISLLINEGYLQSQQGRGTYCVDRSKRRNESRNIGVITTYISEYIFPRVIQGIERVLSKNGYSIILKSTNNSLENERECLKCMLEKNIEGLIIEPTKSAMFSPNIKLYQALDNNQIPYVFIHGYYQNIENKPFVILDDAAGTYAAVKYLTELGHNNIIGIFKADDFQGINRHKGYAKALTDADISYDPDNVIWFHTEDKRIKPANEIRRLINEGRKIDAIACYNDEIAFSVYQTVVDMGLNVPEDISITGFDDSYLSENCPVKFTSVMHPKEKLGEVAAEMLLKILDCNNNCRHQINGSFQKIILPELVIKDSCKRI